MKKRLNHDWKDYGITLIVSLAIPGVSIVEIMLIKSIHYGNQANQENQGQTMIERITGLP
jgi:hypothetical protein